MTAAAAATAATATTKALSTAIQPYTQLVVLRAYLVLIGLSKECCTCTRSAQTTKWSACSCCRCSKHGLCCTECCVSKQTGTS